MSRRRLPARTCAVCGKSLAEVGGARLVRTLESGLVRRHVDAPIGRLPGPAQIIPLDGQHAQTLLVAWGLPSMPSALQGASAQVHEGTTPWFCQRCAKHLCKACGSPLRRVPAADQLSDDGDIWHCPILAVPVSCPTCQPSVSRAMETSQ